MIPKAPLERISGTGRLSWFATRAGKKFTLGCAITFGIGTLSFNLLPHTIFIDKYRELFQLYKKSAPVRLPSKIKQQFASVLSDLKLPREILPYIRPFVVNGFDLFHAGTTHIKSGSVVGIPINFTYESVQDIDTSTLLVANRKIKWDQTEGKELLESLVISEEAKKFAIAQEVLRCQTLEPLLNSVYPVFNVTVAYILCQRINEFTNGFARPLTYRIVIYALVGLFCFGNWAFLKDFTTIHYDTQCIEKVSELGGDYVKGGQEFYANILKRNKALRHLLGNEGVRLYSATGNEQFFLREKRLPIASRKFFFDKKVEELNLAIS